MSGDRFVGRVLGGRYRVDAPIGRGGMGHVYVGEHLRLGTRVAIKTLAPEHLHDESIRQRLLREARIAASVSHPNIVRTIDVDEDERDVYVVMEWIDGDDLSRLLAAEGSLDLERTLTILEPVAEALDAAHEHGMVHRDVKPANIMIRRDGHVFLSDFGLAKQTEAATAITLTGFFVGTTDYAAPEQIEGKLVDARTDVYSLGAVVYQCLTGRVPFDRETDIAVLYAHLRDPPPSVTAAKPGLPAGLDSVVSKAMAKRPDDRYSTCAELIQAARLAAEPQLQAAPATVSEPSVPAGPQPRRYRSRPSLWLIASLVAIVVAAGVVTPLVLGGGGAETGKAPTSGPTSTAERAAAGGVRRLLPSTNIGCTYHEGSSAALRCDIRVPAGAAATAAVAGCGSGFAGAFSMGARGIASRSCTQATIIDLHARRLAYGMVWRPAPFICVSHSDGLRCVNADLDGFFLSQASSHAFPNPVAGAHALTDASTLLIGDHEYAIALALARRALTVLEGRGPADKYEAYANFNAGNALQKLDRCPDALRYLKRADTLEPGNPAVRSAQSACGA